MGSIPRQRVSGASAGPRGDDFPAVLSKKAVQVIQIPQPLFASDSIDGMS